MKCTKFVMNSLTFKINVQNLYMRKQYITLFGLLLISNIALGQNFRKYGNDFLNLGADARGVAMSKSVIGSSNDASATYWNPALLSYQPQDIGISTMYSEYIGGISSYNFISLTRKLNKADAAIGFTFIRFGTDKIPNTINLIGPDGAPDYSRITYFNAADYAFMFSFSKDISPDSSDVKTALGTNLKLINRRADGFGKAWGIGLDAAFSVRWPTSNLALVIKDATTTFLNWDIKFSPEQQVILQQLGNEIISQSSEIIRPTFLLGYGYSFPLSDKTNLLLETNIISTFDGNRNSLINMNNLSIDPHFGTEFDINNKVYIRGGVGNFQRQTDENDTSKTIRTFTPTLGAGVQLGKFSIDYAISRVDLTGSIPFSHFISLNAKLDVKKPAATTPEDIDKIVN